MEQNEHAKVLPPLLVVLIEGVNPHPNNSHPLVMLLEGMSLHPDNKLLPNLHLHTLGSKLKILIGTGSLVLKSTASTRHHSTLEI